MLVCMYKCMNMHSVYIHVLACVYVCTHEHAYRMRSLRICFICNQILKEGAKIVLTKHSQNLREHQQEQKEREKVRTMKLA